MKNEESPSAVLTQEAIPGDADCKSATRLRRITNPA